MRDWAKLHVDISKSRSFAALANQEPRAAVLFLMMLPRADVLGIVDAHPVIFRGEVCPLLAVTEEEIERFLGLIQEHEMILLYQDDRGSRWAWVRSWGKYQDVRWTHVGVPNRPLPEGWTAPDGLQKHLREKPDNPVSVAVEDLCSNYISTTVPTTEFLGAPCERAQDGDVDVEGDSDTEVTTPAPNNGADCDVEKPERQPRTEEEATIKRAFELMTGHDLTATYRKLRDEKKTSGKTGPALRGMGGLVELVGSTNDELIDEFLGDLQPDEKLPPNKKPWGWFSKYFRKALSQEFNWRKKRATNQPPQTVDQHAGYPRMGDSPDG